MTMTGEEIYRNFTEGSTVMLACAGSDVDKLATAYQQIGAGLKHAQQMMMASWTGGAALPAWAAATELANAVEQSADRLTSYGEAHGKQATAFETASRTVVVVPPEPAALNPFEVAAEVFKTGNPAAPFDKIREHQAAVDAHHAAAEINNNVMIAYEKATSGHTIPDDYPTLTATGNPDNTIDHEVDTPPGEDDDPEDGGGEREGGGPVPAGVAPGTGSAGGSGGNPGGFGIGEVGAGGVDPGEVDLDDLPPDPDPDTDPGRTDPSQAPPGPSSGPFGPPTYHGPPPGPPPTGPPPITDPGPPLTGPPPGSGGSSGTGTQAARANASGRTGQLDGSELPGAVPWSAGSGDPSGENARGAGQSAGRGLGVGAGVPGAAGGWRTGPGATPRGAGGPGAFGGAPLSGRKEEDEEHARPDYLIEPDPDDLFGSDERASSPVIGDSWKSE
jgi:hypothetical protein